MKVRFAGNKTRPFVKPVNAWDRVEFFTDRDLKVT